jgi:hypothetical protein
MKPKLVLYCLSPCLFNNVSRFGPLSDSFDFLEKETIGPLNFHYFHFLVEVLLVVVNPDVRKIVVIAKDFLFKVASIYFRLNSLFPIFFVFYL